MGNPSKAKGTRFESAVCDYFRWALDDERIQRLTLHGNRDIGDIGNVYFHGQPVVLECKATRTPNWRNPLLIGLTLNQLATLLNNGLELGPDKDVDFLPGVNAEDSQTSQSGFLFIDHVEGEDHEQHTR